MLTCNVHGLQIWATSPELHPVVYTKTNVKVLRYAEAKNVCANTGNVPKGSAYEMLSLTPVL